MVKVVLKRWYDWFRYRKQRKIAQALCNDIMKRGEVELSKVIQDAVLFGRGKVEISEDGIKHVPYKPFDD